MQNLRRGSRSRCVNQERVDLRAFKYLYCPVSVIEERLNDKARDADSILVS